MHPKIPTRPTVNFSLGYYLQEKIYNNNHTFQDMGPRAHHDMLLKYYPKYCRFLQLDQRYKSRAVIYRIKQIKIAKGFQFDRVEMNKEEIIKLIKILLCNKRHSIEFLPDFTGRWGFSSSSLLEICSFFPKIKVLNVYRSRHDLRKQKPRSDFISRSAEKEILNAYGSFWSALQNVEILNTLTSSPEIWLVFQKMQSSERFFSSLKTFILTINIPRPISHQYPRMELFQALLKFPGVLKHVTHLRFPRDFEGFHIYGTQVQSLIESCPKLYSLTFPIHKEFSDPTKKHLTLAPLKSLQNVAILTLKVYDVWSFIEAFEFSSSLKKLQLHLYYRSDWNKIWKELYQEDPSQIKDMEKHQKLLNFFERFKQLTSLKSLELNMPRFTETKDILTSFIFPLLKSVPKLEDFQCQLYRDSAKNHDAFDISMFLDGIAASLDQLKSFRILQRSGQHYSIEKEDLVLTFNPQKIYSFPHLREINIDTFVSQDFDFKNFLTMIINSETNSPLAKKKISFSRVYIDSIPSFRKVLKVFKEAEQYQTLEVYLGIIFCPGSLPDLLTYFDSPIIPACNVSIDLKIFLSASKKSAFSATGLEIMREFFGKMKFDTYILVKKKSRYSSYQQIDCQPAIINNSRKIDYDYHSRDDSDDEKENFDANKNENSPAWGGTISPDQVENNSLNEYENSPTWGGPISPDPDVYYRRKEYENSPAWGGYVSPDEDGENQVEDAEDSVSEDKSHEVSEF